LKINPEKRKSGNQSLDMPQDELMPEECKSKLRSWIQKREFMKNGMASWANRVAIY
jgi:hypothetical protein